MAFTSLMGVAKLMNYSFLRERVRRATFDFGEERWLVVFLLGWLVLQPRIVMLLAHVQHLARREHEALAGIGPAHMAGG
jgi:hypothetical protein